MVCLAIAAHSPMDFRGLQPLVNSQVQFLKLAATACLFMRAACLFMCAACLFMCRGPLFICRGPLFRCCPTWDTSRLYLGHLLNLGHCEAKRGPTHSSGQVSGES